MFPTRRGPFVALVILLHRQFPEIDDPVDLIRRGGVLVDGAPVLNPRSMVRSDAALRLSVDRPLRGTVKLGGALVAFQLDVAGFVGLDLGAAAGGFTQALLDAGAARVYAVDVGVGQLRGRLRLDSRVVNLERTNLAELDRSVIAEPVDIVTMDLSYLSVADAVPQLRSVSLAPRACLVALVKPTFELHGARLLAQPVEVARAVHTAVKTLSKEGWVVAGDVASHVTGSHGAIEHFILARHL